jgi:hypothetical protein
MDARTICEGAAERNGSEANAPLFPQVEEDHHPSS